jgi:hypothetical protein
VIAKRGSSQRRYGLWVVGGAILLLLTAGLLSVKAQFEFPEVQSVKGQDVSPTFEGWERNPDGTFSLWFGYYNRNSDEEVDVPIGPENAFDLGNGDQGQPAHFYPGTRWWVFKVVVPQDWPKDKRLVWTLTNRGRTNLAKGWLQPEWEVDDLVLSANASADPFLSNVTRSIAGNTAPSITGGPAQTITLPATATLTATVTDDGLPKPKGLGDRSGKVQGVRVRWILYRGPGKVQFDPDASPYVYGKPLTAQTNVSFSVPGNYRLRAIASDGALFSTYDVDVKVNPNPSTSTRTSSTSGG